MTKLQELLDLNEFPIDIREADDRVLESLRELYVVETILLNGKPSEFHQITGLKEDLND